MHYGVLIMPELLDLLFYQLYKLLISAAVQAVPTVQGQQADTAETFNSQLFDQSRYRLKDIPCAAGIGAAFRIKTYVQLLEPAKFKGLVRDAQSGQLGLLFNSDNMRA